MTSTIRLERRLAHDAAVSLWNDLSDKTGATIELDCSDVRHISATALQVLLVADQACRTNGQQLNFLSPSDAFLEGLRTLGAEDLLSGGSA